MNPKHLQKLFFVVILFTFSCASYQDVPYYQNLRADNVVREEIKNYSPLTIQPGDILTIHVASLNPEADAVFNYDLNLLYKTDATSTSSTSSGAGSIADYSISEHLVDHDGNINLPMIGILKVAGYTTNDIVKQTEAKLQNFLSKPIVTVVIQNFKISVLGDVKNPGTFTSGNEKVTLNEALSFAGDLNTTGLRKNVLLIREINGTREYVHLDLTSKDIFNSPYYYLKNNDIIYVQPSRIRVSNDSDNVLLGRITVIISALSVIAILVRK
jgi:polysaccharide export outer membrane protein